MLEETASVLKSIVSKHEVDFYFKASYKKANRTSAGSFMGVGDEKALSWLNFVGKKFEIKTITDIHSEAEAALAAQFVDVLQIPAFLARQTEILQAAARTGKTINIKKGQFMAPDDMLKAAQKCVSAGNPNLMLTERGTFFGYHDLVVDFRSLAIMSEYGFPVIYDATHSVQKPSLGAQSGGAPEFIPILARAAVAAGVDGIFFETHPEPSKAKSDAATQLKLCDAKKFIDDLIGLTKYINSNLL
jgi:2-dehydro-3-deoxyphosphooctonate aldolase (KDO 8-P synthase)